MKFNAIHLGVIWMKPGHHFVDKQFYVLNQKLMAPFII